MMHDGWHWWMPIPGILWLLLVAVVIVGVVLLVRSRGDAPPSGDGRSAMDVLDERYARGEIDREDYLQRKDDLLTPREARTRQQGRS
jgi:putative membrane protein